MNWKQGSSNYENARKGQHDKTIGSPGRLTEVEIYKHLAKHTANPYFQHTESEPPWRNEERKPTIEPQNKRGEALPKFSKCFHYIVQ